MPIAPRLTRKVGADANGGIAAPSCSGESALGHPARRRTLFHKDMADARMTQSRGRETGTFPWTSPAAATASRAHRIRLMAFILLQMRDQSGQENGRMTNGKGGDGQV